MRTVYICAPYAAASHDGRERNTRRAESLARLAILAGYAPICMHSGIHRGAYGDDANLEDREAGLAVCERIVESCDEMWALFPDDWEPSEGMKRELDALWPVEPARTGTWAEWSQQLRLYGAVRHLAEDLA
jgi:hypothetical protein